MKYAVDRIVEDIVVLENIETGEIIERKINEFPEKIHDGSVVILSDDKISLDITEEKERKESFRKRLERLKQIK